MTDPEGDGIWTLTIPLAAGTYEYKYSADNWGSQETLLAGSPCTVTNFGFTNRTLTVSADAVLPVVCWGACSDCGSAPNIVDITFQLDMNGQTGFTTPEVNGTFNGWCGGCFQLTDGDGDGIWTGTATIQELLVDTDEGPRADTSMEGLAKLKTVFAARGSVTAGNSSQTSDGAGALILASEKAIQTHGLKPLARFVSYASRGVPPHIMGIGPIEAIPAALRYAGLQQDALDWIELNEAFAAQSLAVIQTLGLDPAKVNPMGGAIALGHPLGATGAIRSASVIHALHRHQLKLGMVTMCVGMGQGVAAIFERV
jgi:hypothetical protein